MGNRAQLYPSAGTSVKDVVTLYQRFQGVGSVNGTLPAVASTTGVSAPSGMNRARGLICTRTGVGTYSITVQNNPLVAGGNNFTPQFFQMLNCNLMTPGGTRWAWACTGYGVSNGVLSFTIQTFISNTGTLTDLPTTDELWVTLDCSANTVA